MATLIAAADYKILADYYNEEKRWELEALRRWRALYKRKDYAFEFIVEHGVRATARTLKNFTFDYFGAFRGSVYTANIHNSLAFVPKCEIRRVYKGCEIRVKSESW